jgi:16S rRNA (cytidine1402-2'-O)-methyltransferase
MPGTLFVVATPIGNLEDITLRALRVLREVDVIAAEDTRRTSHLLARHAISTPTTSLHEHNEAGKSASLVARLERGENIALVSDAGTPTVSDPGGHLIRTAIDAGLRVEPIPGPSAVLAALAVAGAPTDTFCFLGFPPTRSKDRKQWFENLGKMSGTVVLFEAPHRIHRTLDELARTLGDIGVTVGRELTKVHEELVRGPISIVRSKLPEPKGEFTIVVNIGQKTDIEATETINPSIIMAEYGQITENSGLGRRQALALLAKKHRIGTNAVYRIIESHNKSIK